MTSSNSGKQLSFKTRRRLKWLVGLGLCYTIFGFLILPPIVKALAVRQLKKELKREAFIESVRMNPYAMSVTIRGLQIKDPDRQTFLSWEEVYVNFRLLSVFARAWDFDRIRVIDPYMRVQLNKDLTFNFSDILESQAAAQRNAGPKKPAGPMAVAVRQLLVDGARLEFTDLTPRKPFRRVIGPVKLELNGFHTDPDSRNPHVFTGSTETGERFRWGGHFSLEPVRAFGEFAVENVQLRELAPLYQDLVQFEVRDGIAALSLSYDVEFSATATNVAVSNLTAGVRSLKVGLPGVADNLLELPEAAVSGVSADLLQRSLEVGLVAARGARLNVYRGTNAQFNLATAATPVPNESAPAGVLKVLQAATNAFSQLLNSTNLATATVGEVSIQDCAVNYRDDSCVPPAQLILDQIRVEARNLSNWGGSNMTAGASLRWNTNGSVRVEAGVGLAPLAAEVNLDLNRLNVAPLDPYLRPHLNAYLLGSLVSLSGRVQLQSRPGHLPDIRFSGGGGLDELNVLGSTSEDLLKWGSLRFDGVAASLDPLSLTVSSVVLSNLVARVVIETNQTVNVLAVLPGADTNVATGADASTLVADDGAGRGGAIKEAFARVKTVLGMDTNVAASMGLPRVEVGRIRVEDSEVWFLDRSVTPPARASLQNIRARINDISTEEMRRAKIHVETLVGGTGPVELAAELNPLHAKDSTQARISLKRVQLTPADPYSARLLGYRLTRGHLDVNVDYTISASELKGRNHIVLDQLTLGSKVPSPDATSLPVKLGIALLKDSSGRIEIDVPVEGNLDDPEFRLGKVIWGVVANVFVKAVASPFSLLGSLVGGSGGEDMQFQEFEAGSAELGEGARGKLAALAKAFEARPELQVVVEGNVDVELDGWALRRSKMEQQLRLARWNALRASARESMKPEDVTLPPEVRVDLVRNQFRALVESNPGSALAPPPAAVLKARTNAVSVPRSGARSEMEKGASRLVSETWTPSAAAGTAAGTTAVVNETTAAPDGRPTVGQMEDSLTASQILTDADYAALAGARAQRVQSHLVQDLRIAADRVFLGDPGGGAFGTNGNRVVLQLQ